MFMDVRPECLKLLGGTKSAYLSAMEYTANRLTSSMPTLSRNEWNYLADVLNGTLFDVQYTGEVLAFEVSDGNKYEQLGTKWNVDVKVLEAKMQALSVDEVIYLLFAIHYLWSNCETIDLRNDEWWTLEYRLAHSDACEPIDLCVS